MKGKFGKYGMKSLQGIQLAFGIFSPNDPDSRVQLIVEDSGDEPEQALKALNRLVLKHHVVAVIGPMLSKGVDQVSQRAQELGVPLISLSRRAGAQLDYVFQAGLTQQLQTYEIARYAVQNLSLRRFALLYPNDKFGSEISQSFWDAIEALGGKIVGAESYRPEETDFRQTVDKLSGLYYPEARQRELDLLSQEREANHIKKRTRKTEQFFNLRPIVDYDAVFIPDDPKVAGQILPTFAYRDVENIKFLGTSTWNSPDFLSRVQNYAEHAIFADAFFAESNSVTTRRFFDKYKASFNQEPTSLEAMAYDAGAILQKIVTSTRHPLSRSEIRDQLKGVKEFQGVTGKIFFKDGQFFRDLRIIKVKDGHFVEARQ
jgi:ABC-type branched-subunit amino acid transport system substrate-binding protein